uniref:Uncharacterized protein n=1 Tax=Globodera pallida TaxID=36090 RepID=A0A183CI25_GLOPA
MEFNGMNTEQNIERTASLITNDATTVTGTGSQHGKPNRGRRLGPAQRIRAETQKQLTRAREQCQIQISAGIRRIRCFFTAEEKLIKTIS